MKGNNQTAAIIVAMITARNDRREKIIIELVDVSWMLLVFITLRVIIANITISFNTLHLVFGYRYSLYIKCISL